MAGNLSKNARNQNELAVYWRQFVVMMKKNTILQYRYWRSTILQIAVIPIVFLLLLTLLQSSSNARNSREVLEPYKYPLETLAKCKGLKDSSFCVSYMYSPKTPETDMIIKILADKDKERSGRDWTISANELTDLSSPLTKSYDFVPVANPEFIYNYTLKYPNTTLFGISFTLNPNTKISNPNIAYQVWFNYSLMANGSDVYSQPVVSTFRGLDEAILSYYSDNSGATKTDFKVTVRDWPLVSPAVLGQNVVTQLGSTFFYCSSMTILIFILNSIMQDKEQKLRHGMEIMGLKPAVYWISVYLSNMILMLLNTLFLIAMGNILGFWFFTRSDFGTLFLTFFLFGNSLIPLAMFFSTFFRTAKLATNVAIFFLIIGLLFVNFVFSSTFLGYIWWDSSTDPNFALCFQLLLPFFNFGKLFLDISNKASGQLDFITGTVVLGPGFTYNDTLHPVEKIYLPAYDEKDRRPNVPAPGQSFIFLIINFFIYWIAAWYFDNVIPDEYGQSRPFYFFLQPTYWGFNMGTKAKSIDSDASLRDNADEAEEVHEERKLTLEKEKSGDNKDYPIRIVNLRKVFQSNIFFPSKTDKVAVHSLCLSFQEGKLLALLGQNGAGKTTTMNIMSGLTPASSGRISIYGKNVATEIEDVRANLGVCPQHDILFNDLTAKEHIDLYGGIKGVSQQEIEKITKERFEWVQLTKVTNVRAGTFSGGMKRRLSVVISTIGDPKVVFMDEPTTGMDPVNRRHVWSFIEEFKKGRIVVLTTHSMEEADILGDRIAIMAHGRLRALGNSIQLKNKYGTGYRFSLNTHPDQSKILNELIMSKLSSAKLEDSTAGSMIYQLPREKSSLIPEFVEFVEKNEKAKQLILAWGISQATLEEVFLLLIRKANPAGYSGYEKK